MKKTRTRGYMGFRPFFTPPMVEVAVTFVDNDADAPWALSRKKRVASTEHVLVIHSYPWQALMEGQHETFLELLELAFDSAPGSRGPQVKDLMEEILKEELIS